MSLGQVVLARHRQCRPPLRLLMEFSVIIGLAPLVAAAQAVPEKCASIYSSNGAVPGDQQCVALAATALTGLGNFECTSNPTFVRSYCGEFTPEAEIVNENEPLPDFAGDDTVGNTEESEETLEESGDGSTDGALPDFEEIIGTGPTGNSDGGANDPQTIDNGPTFPSAVGVRCAGENPIPTLPPPIEYVASAVLGEPYASISTGITVVNLLDSTVAARETGDSSRLYENVQGMLMPLLAVEGPLTTAFEDFSDYVDIGIALPGSGLNSSAFVCREE